MAGECILCLLQTKPCGFILVLEHRYELTDADALVLLDQLRAGPT